MTLDEVAEVMAQPEYANRIAVLVREDRHGYVAEWGGVEYRAGNPFGLDSVLANAGVPAPRNLFLIDPEEVTR